MMDREKVIEGLKYCTEAGNNCNMSCPYYGIVDCEWFLKADAVNLLSQLKTQEPRVMTLDEIKDYLDDPDGDKKPLWLEWHSIPALSGWVLASQVSYLMKRYMDSYNNTWRPWTSRPTDEQREATPWSD